MVHTTTESKPPTVSPDEVLTIPVAAAAASSLTEIKQEESTIEMPTKTVDDEKDSGSAITVHELEVSDIKGDDTDSLAAIEKSSRSAANCKNDGGDGMYQPGSRLEALDMSTNKWYGVKVVEVDWDDREVLIHFEKWSQRFDEWLPMDSSRLRAVGDRLESQTDKPSGYRVGETVMATWSDCRKYPARVKAILSGDIVEVLFFDGFVKRMKLSKIAKCTGDQGIEPPTSFPLLPSILHGPAALMSKAERRERKRKIPTVVELFQCKKTSKKPKGVSDSPRPSVTSPRPSIASPRSSIASPRPALMSPSHDESAKDSGNEAEKSKSKYSDWTASDNEGEKTYINLDTSFTQEEGTAEDAAVKKKGEQGGKLKSKSKPVDAKKGGKVEKRKRSYNKVFLDDSPAGTFRESYPFKGRRTNEAIPPNDYDNWEPEGQEAYVVETSDGLRRSIIVADDRLPEGWAKHTIQRRSGNSAGKWDVFLVSPTGRRFRSRKEMVTYFTDSGKEYKKELFDFTLRGLCKRHVCNMMRKRDDTVYIKKVDKRQKQAPARPKPAVPQTPAAEPASEEDLSHRRVKTLLPKTPSQQRGEGQATPPPPPHHPCTIAPPATPAPPPLDDGKVYVGTLEIQMQDNALVCPKEGCLKHFRRENLLQMHMKHYHPEYTQFLGSTPNVADLAYARTVGEPIEDIVPPSRTLAVAVNRFEASKKAKQLAAMSPPPLVEADKKKPPPRKEAASDARKSTKVEPKTPPPPSAPPTKDILSGAPLDLEQFIKPMKCATVAQSTPLRDLLRKEPAPLRGPKQGLTAGIKTLLPIHRLVTSPKDVTQKKADDWPGYPPSPGVPGDGGQGGSSHKSRVRKRRLSDNYADAHSTKRKKLVKPKSLDDSADSAVSPSASAGDDSGTPSFLTPAARGAAFKRKTPTLAAALAQPYPDATLSDSYPDAFAALDPLEPIGSPLAPLTPAELVEEQLNKIDIINCTCGIVEEDGLMIQCDLCLCWQHGHCNGIERESQVPDKYVCAICLHPARARASMRHLHDQAWLKEGVLASFDKVARPPKHTDALRRSHDLAATLLEVRDVVHSLRVKVNMADAADHPKLYLWAKPWEKDTFDSPEPDQAPADVDLKPEADLPVAKMMKTDATQEHDMLKPMDPGAAASVETGSGTDDATLAQTGGGNGDKEDASQLDSNLLLQALTGGSNNGSLNGTLNNDLINDLNNDPQNQLLQFPICQSELMRFAHSMADNLKVTVPDAPAAAPEPEKPIDPVECRLLMLDHIQHHQQQVKDKLQMLEDEIAALEAEDPETLAEETVSFYPQTKQTIKMLLRDLTTVRNLAAIN